MKTTRLILLAAAFSLLIGTGSRLWAQAPATGIVAPSPTGAVGADVANNGNESGKTLPWVVKLKPFYSRVYVGPDGTNSAFNGFSGRKILDGLPFDIDGEIVLYGKNTPEAENEVQGMKIGLKFDELHLIHNLQWHEYHGCPVALIRLHYADGSNCDFTMQYDVQVAANRLLSEETETLTDANSKLIWRGPGPYKGDARLFKTVLHNPFPDKLVDSMAAISTHSRSSYVLVAATAAKSDPAREISPPMPLNQPAWHFDGTLKIRVVDEKTGEPVTSADIYPFMDVDGNGIVADPVLTGSNGVAVVKYPVSRTSSMGIGLSKTGYLENRGYWQNGDIPEEITYRLTAGNTRVQGVVRAPDGQPVAGVSVQLIGGNGARGENLKTDANGKFELDWNPRQFPGQNDSTTCVLARDPEHNLAAVQDLDEDTAILDLKLAPGLTLAGRAEAGGKPLTNATAQVVFWTGRSGMWLQGLARTNTPGQYEIPALPPGRKYGVVVSAPGYGQKQNNNLDISSEAGRQELDPVELKPANLQLAGQVLDADDKPVASCSVSLFGENQPGANTRTDRDGRFSFNHICEGTLHISANSLRAFGNVSAEGGDTNVVLHLGENMGYSPDSKPHKLHGVVTDDGGQPVAGAQVAVFPNNGARWVKTGTNGEYSLNWSLQSWQMQNGGATLVLRDPAHNLAGTEELPEETTNLNVKLKPALVLSGQVKNADGSPLALAQVGLWLKAGNSYDQLNEQPTIPVNAQGRFEMMCLPPDAQYIVYASAKGYGKAQDQLQPEYESNRVELAPFVLKHAERIIAGQVLKDDDQPASGVNVQLNGEGQPDGYMTTDRQGRFHFQVCEGQISLSAYSQNGGGNAQATVDAGDTNIVMTMTTASGEFREPPRRAALKGNPLPDLAVVNLAAAAKTGQPVLLCLFDAAQRPSRHVISQLNQQAAALRQKNLCVLGIQAAVINDELFNAWKGASPVAVPVGRVMEKTAKTKWASETAALPWLILTDASHKVVAEGFSSDDLDAQIQKLAK